MGKTNTAVEHHKRLSADGMGTAHVAGDWIASSGFGSTAAVTFTGIANDSRGHVIVTCGGTGQGANPTLTLTFKDGAWETAPIMLTDRVGATQPTIRMQAVCTTTTAVLTFRGTASGSEVYEFTFLVRG